MKKEQTGLLEAADMLDNLKDGVNVLDCIAQALEVEEIKFFAYALLYVANSMRDKIDAIAEAVDNVRKGGEKG